MKYILSISFWLFFCLSNVSAAEITGTISTDPKNLSGNPVNQTASSTVDQNEAINSGEVKTSPLGGSLFVNKSQSAIRENSKKQASQPKVLGVVMYLDGSLLRDENHRIFLIKGQYKKPISSLGELKKYQKQPIYNVTDEELAVYQTRWHLNGELIREQGTAPVYIIENNRRRHILNQKELKKYYLGQEIFNINQDEMKLY